MLGLPPAQIIAALACVAAELRVGVLPDRAAPWWMLTTNNMGLMWVAMWRRGSPCVDRAVRASRRDHEHAIIDNIVPDFPRINKSSNLSYSGHDL